MTEREEIPGSDAEALLASSEAAAGTLAVAGGLLIGGPEGAVATSLSAPFLVRSLRWAATEVRTRMLSYREEVRAAGALAYAAEDVASRLSAGEQPRQDDFFTAKPRHGRSRAQEIIEGVLITAQRSYEERKVPYIGRLYSGIAFSDLNATEAHHLVRLADDLTYTQFALLSLFGRNAAGGNSLGLREQMFPSTDPESVTGIALVVLALSQRALISFHDSAHRTGQGWTALSPSEISPMHTRLQAAGSALHNLARLDQIPHEVTAPILALLQASEEEPAQDKELE